MAKSKNAKKDKAKGASRTKLPIIPLDFGSADDFLGLMLEGEDRGN